MTLPEIAAALDTDDSDLTLLAWADSLEEQDDTKGARLIRRILSSGRRPQRIANTHGTWHWRYGCICSPREVMTLQKCNSIHETSDMGDHVRHRHLVGGRLYYAMEHNHNRWDGSDPMCLNSGGNWVVFDTRHQAFEALLEALKEIGI